MPDKENLPTTDDAPTSKPDQVAEEVVTSAETSENAPTPAEEPVAGLRENFNRQTRLFFDFKYILWVYLALIAVAEVLTAFSIIQIGLPLHAILLVTLLVHGAIGQNEELRQMALALSLAPLIRLLSLSLPLLSFNQLAWYPLVAGPLLLACWLIVRLLKIQPAELGLRRGRLTLQLLIGTGGIGLGAVEYYILQPRPLFGVLSWELVVIGGLNLLFSTGFNEEIIFRGLLQRVGRPALKKQNILYVSLLFAALHMGYLSVLDLLFVFAVGLVFAYIVEWDRSLLGVVIAHGLTNTTMFLLMPYVAEYPGEPLSQFMPWLIAVTTLLSLIGIVLLALANRRPGSKDKPRLGLPLTPEPTGSN